MQIHSLKLNPRRKRKRTIGRGGKKGTYSGRGMKGQKSRSGAKINPLFEGGRSTLIERLKKKRGFKAVYAKKVTVRLSDLGSYFKEGEEINKKSLIKAGLVDKMKAVRGIKIIGLGKIAKKYTVDKEILLSKNSRKALLGE